MLESTSSELEEIIREERVQVPIKKLVEVLGLLIIMTILASFKGSAKFPSMIGIKYCGTAYWSLNITMFVICAVYIKILIDRFTTLD